MLFFQNDIDRYIPGVWVYIRPSWGKTCLLNSAKHVVSWEGIMLMWVPQNQQKNTFPSGCAHCLSVVKKFNSYDQTCGYVLTPTSKIRVLQIT